MKKLVETLLGAGVLNMNMVESCSKFACIPVPEDIIETGYDESIKRIEEVLTESNLCCVKETDLDALLEYSKSVETVKLFLDDEPVEVFAGRTKLGEYLIPCAGMDNIPDMDEWRNFYIETPNGRVSISSARVLSYGSVDAFVACTPVENEHRSCPTALVVNHVRNNPKSI